MATQPQLTDALTTDHLRGDLKGRSVRGGAATISSQGAQFLLQSIMTVVLARLLTPADFGLVAMVTAITGLGQAFADLGLSEATIQREDITHEQVSALFWINVAVGLTLTLITAALAPVLVWFYREPHLKEITFVLSSVFLIGGLRVQHDALLKRQMRFTSVAIRDAASIAMGVALAIAMAWRGAGYWAIVAFPLASQFTRMALSWSAVRWIPSLPRRGANVGPLVAFGGTVASSYLFSYLIRNADNVLVGWWWGASPLGLYSRAYNLLMLPVRQLSAPMGSVLVPAFSRLQNDAERFARYYLRMAHLLMWIGAPAFGFFFVAAEPTIILLLGRQWREAAPVFQFLALCGPCQVLYPLCVWTLVSRGESSRLLRLLLFMCPVMVASFAIGLPFGVKGVALSGSLVLIAIFPWVLRFTQHGTEVTLLDLGKTIICPISLSLGGVCLAELALRFIAPQHILAQLAVDALSFLAAGGLGLLLPTPRKEMLSFREIVHELRRSRQIA